MIVQQILLILGDKHTYTALLGPTHFFIFEIFSLKPNFHLHKWRNPSYTALLRPTHLLISVKSATYTIIWQVRVHKPKTIVVETTYYYRALVETKAL